ncbi:hypothetical protein Verru16b_00767 [Lacunisphaera limnophila]|uniref:Uncharacterized protein n=1 Tax=Lacunisphaera limnophila TaxID=1838286 RepID=A0A1D8AS34_9BACT|nr:hypothetical protein [Lacunisphaera limnophila]AOS43713.1 hypothetical protein Verru16b_00767 [Lacunisphaera limnophila]
MNEDQIQSAAAVRLGMVLGQSAALAADLALRSGAAAQDVPYARLSQVLTKAGQIMAWTASGTEIGGEHVLHAQEH